MICIGRFEIEHDGNGWILWEKKTAISRETKEEKVKRLPRYYPNLEMCCNKIIDLSAIDSNTAQEVIDSIHSAKEEIRRVLSERASA